MGLRNCCCCLSLKTGALIIAILCLVGGVGGIIGGIVQSVDDMMAGWITWELQTSGQQFVNLLKFRDVLEVLHISYIVFAVLYVITSILLITATFVERAELIPPFLLLMVVTVFYFMIFTPIYMVQFYYYKNNVGVLIGVVLAVYAVTVAVYGYLFAVVYYFYKQLKGDNSVTIIT